MDLVVARTAKDVRESSNGTWYQTNHRCNRTPREVRELNLAWRLSVVFQQANPAGVLATAGSSTDFTLQTSVKGGKTYQLRAPSAPVRTEWIEALTKVIEASGTKMDQMGDNGLAEEEEAEPEPSAEDLAKIEQEKYAPHALSPHCVLSSALCKTRACD